MRIIVIMMAALIGLAGCEDSTGNAPRFVEQEKMRSDFIDSESVDESVHVQAKAKISSIVQKIKLKLMTDYSGNFNKLAADLGNKNGTALLAALGLKAGLLDGNFYKTSDFYFTFSDGKMHVEALKEQGNKRGHFKESFRIK